MQNQSKIDDQNYEKQLFAEGRHNQTYLYRHNYKSKNIICKRFSLVILRPLPIIDAFFDKIAQMNLRRSVKVLGYSVDADNKLLKVYEEYCQGGSLRSRIQKKSTKITKAKAFKDFQLICKDLALLQQNSMLSSQASYDKLLVASCDGQVMAKLQICYKPILKPSTDSITNFLATQTFAQSVVRCMIGDMKQLSNNPKQRTLKEFLNLSRRGSFLSLSESNFWNLKVMQLKESRLNPKEIYDFFFKHSSFIQPYITDNLQPVIFRYYVMLYLKQELLKFKDLESASVLPNYLDSKLLLECPCVKSLWTEYQVLYTQIEGVIQVLQEQLGIQGKQYQFRSMQNQYQQLCKSFFQRFKNRKDIEQSQLGRLLCKILIFYHLECIFQEFGLFKPLGVRHKTISSLQNAIASCSSGQALQFCSLVLSWAKLKSHQ